MAKDMGDATIDVLNAEKERTGAENLQQLVLAWLIKRGCHVLVKTSVKERMHSNAHATKLVNSPGWSEDPLSELASGSEMLAMCGGSDECAAVFRNMGSEQG